LILLIDNYDSFVDNLARYFRQLGCDTQSLRNDQLSRDKVKQLNPDAIVISPGPCTPAQAGYSVDCVKDFAGSIPILGVCLGHQAIVEAFGGEVVCSGQPVHGRKHELTHSGGLIFEDLPERFYVGRYHSLIAPVSRIPECLEVTAKLDDGTVMAVQHRVHNIHGVQFHPESVLTEHGYAMLANFCVSAGIGVASPIPTGENV